MTDQLFSVLKGIAVQRPLTAEMDLPSQNTFPGTEQDQTEAERETAKVNWQLLRLATFMAGSKASSSEEVESALGEIESWLNLKIEELTLDEGGSSPLIKGTAVYLQTATPAGPTWRYLHSVFTALESLKAASQLVSLASRKGSKTPKLSKERIDRLSVLVPKVFELVRSNARALKLQIHESGVLGSLVDSILYGNESEKYEQELQETLENGLDMTSLELLCSSLMESWDSALSGVMVVKL